MFKNEVRKQVVLGDNDLVITPVNSDYEPHS